MTALQTKWAQMSWYRRILLVGMAAEILVFFLATLVTVNRPGLEYQDSLLYPSIQGDLQIYQGTVDGKTARFTASPTGEVSYQWGDYTYGPYQIYKDATAVPDDFERSQGIEIRLEDEVLFRGCYLPDAALPLIQKDGEPVWEFNFSASAGADTVIFVDGREVTQKERYEPSLASLARVALDPDLTHRGSILLYLATTLLALLNMVQICFPHLFFRLSLWGRVRNLDDAEPSDFYIAMEHIEWIVLAIVCLVLYVLSLNTIYA